MKSQKMILILFSLTVVLLFVSIGFEIYLYQQIRGLSEVIASGQNIQKKIEGEPAASHKIDEKQITKTESRDSSDTSYIISANKSNAVADKAEAAVNNEINELEYQLDAAEEEVDMATSQLSEELTKKDEYKKAMKNLSSSHSSDAAMKRANEESAIRMADDYDPLFKKLNMSEEEFAEFKDILIEKNIELFSSSYSIDAPEEEKQAAREKSREAFIKYDNQLREFLGEEQYGIYQSYSMRVHYYKDLNEFMETLPPDNRISEEETDIFVESMYEGNRVVNMENAFIGSYTSYSQKEMMERSLKIQKLANEKYVEASRSFLSPEQVEQYKAYLQKKVDRQESSMKIQEYLYSD